MSPTSKHTSFSTSQRGELVPPLRKIPAVEAAPVEGDTANQADINRAEGPLSDGSDRPFANPLATRRTKIYPYSRYNPSYNRSQMQSLICH